MEGHKLKAKKGTLRIDLASFGLADLGLQKNGNFPPHFSSRNSPMSYQEKRINLELSKLCLTIKKDHVWLLWNSGGNRFKIHAGFFKFPIIIRAADLNHRQN